MQFGDLLGLKADLWVFDCDGVIYEDAKKAEEDVVDRMISFIASKYCCSRKEASDIRRRLLKKHEVSHSITALILEGFDEEEILEKTYFSVDFDRLGIVFSSQMRDLLASLSGKKVILTNNHSEWARRVSEEIGILEYFSAIYGIRGPGNIQKPNPMAFQLVQNEMGINKNIIFVDDEVCNVAAAVQFGWKAVLKRSGQN